MITRLFIIMPFVACALLTLCFILPACRELRLGRCARAACASVVLLACSKFFFYWLLGGNAFNPELPLAVIWSWNWLYSSIFLLFGLYITTAFLPRRFRLSPAAKLTVLPAVAAALAGWGVWNGIRIPSAREIEVECPSLPKNLDGYRIVHITDIHASSAAPRWRTEAIVKAANATDADLAVCTGDIVDGSPELHGRDVEPIKELKAKDGVWFSTGNHEFYGDWIGWQKLYDEWGVKFLRGECVFPRDGLALGGVDDKVAERFDPSTNAMDVARAFAKATNGEFRVLLQHRPKEFNENAEFHGIGLQLSGHTHGGVMPLMRSLVALFNGGRVRGVYSASGESGEKLFVSPGCGQWAGFPIRLFDDSEITVIVLRRPKTENR